jgi:hypothetical protein
MWMMLGLVGIAIVVAGLVGLLKPMMFRTRGRAALACLGGFLLFVVGVLNDGSRRPDAGPAATTTTLPVETVAPAAPAAAAPAATWTTIASWSGSGIKETESFVTQTREWRISWRTTNEPSPRASLLQIFVHDASNNRMVSLAANQQGLGQDTSYVRSAPGRHYLKINSANADWTVTAEELR